MKTIAGLGESLNLPITAEGIEEASIADRLAQMGCHKGQGYLFGRPTSIANTRRLLAERRLLAAQQTPPVPLVVQQEPVPVTSQRLAG